MLLGDSAGAMEARPDVLLIVWDGLVFLDVPLVQKEVISLPLQKQFGTHKLKKYSEVARGSCN